MSGGAGQSDGPGPSTPAPVARAVLDVRGASRAYGSRAVLDRVDLFLRGGEIYALVGPNGAGKTTLIRAICGRLVLDSGTVRLDGTDPRGDSTARAALGLVPQEIALYPTLTVRENLEVLGRLAGVDRREIPAAVDHALEWTGLSARRDERAGRLSGGMKRRLNVAAGTLHRPKVLLLDEPTVGVDPAARDAVHELLRSLRERGMSVLLTTHDMEQAEDLADRIGILVNGRLRAEGPLEALVRECFGDGHQILLRLAAAPDSGARERLASDGLRAAGDDRTWSGRLDRSTGGIDALSGLGRRLASAGLVAEEIRLREPGLREVYFHVTGREFEA